MKPTRRDFLLGAGALGLSWPQLLSAAPGRCRLVMVTALGGWDVTYCIDPRTSGPRVDGPDADLGPGATSSEDITTFSGIPVITNEEKRPKLSRFFETWGHRCRVVNGLQVGSISHDSCRVRLLTGSLADTRPDLGAIAGAYLGSELPVPYMDLGGVGMVGELAASSGRTGQTNQIKTLLRRRTPVDAPKGSGLRYPLYVPDNRDAAAIDAWLASQADAAAARGAQGRGASRVADWFEANERATALRTDGAAFGGALDRGSFRALDAQVDLAIELFEAGLSQAVAVDSGLFWDTHTNNADQHAAINTLFGGLRRLASGLDRAGMLDDTLVVVLSEMTRTPRRNAAGGKDHWPVTSAMLFGGPIRSGRVLGNSDEGLDAGPVDLATGMPDSAGSAPRYDHFISGVLAGLDVDPGPWFPGVTPLGGLLT